MVGKYGTELKDLVGFDFVGQVFQATDSWDHILDHGLWVGEGYSPTPHHGCHHLLELSKLIFYAVEPGYRNGGMLNLLILHSNEQVSTYRIRGIRGLTR